jgi:hypothetical protein
MEQKKVSIRFSAGDSFDLPGKRIDEKERRMRRLHCSAKLIVARVPGLIALGLTVPGSMLREGSEPAKKCGLFLCALSVAAQKDRPPNFGEQRS